MNCSTSAVTGFIVAAIAALTVAIGLALAAFALTPPWNGASLGAAALSVAGTMLLLNSIQAAINTFSACMNPSGAGVCMGNIVNARNMLTGIRASLGIAISSFGLAAIKILVPWVGQYLAADPVHFGITGCGISIGLLIAIRAEVSAFQNCMNRSRKP